MAQRTVNARQLEVLEWIVEGCPKRDWPNDTYKATAAALKGRRLVTISRKGGVWKAEATDAGRYFVEHGFYPDGHWASAKSTASKPVLARSSSRAARVTGARPVEQMVADVIAGGGRLEIAAEEADRYRGLVSSASRYNKVPEGKLLKYHRQYWYSGPASIELVDQPQWMTAVLDPITPHEKLTKPHPAIVAARADTADRLRFKQPVRQRALRLLDALAKEATKRGYKVTAPKVDRYNRAPFGDLHITIGEHEARLTVSEQDDKVPHVPTAKELKDVEGPWGRRIPKYDKVPSGRLDISVDSRWGAVRQSNYGDTKTLNLDDRLAQVLQEVELRAADAEKRRLQKEQEEAEHLARWEQVRAEALVAYRESHRAEVLRGQVEAWRRNQELAAYLEAMTARIAELTDDARDAAEDWLAWATSYLASTSPLQRTLKMPADPKPTPDALKPFMRGLSPYGP